MAIIIQNIYGTDKRVYDNTVCDQILISEDKLRLKLEKYISAAKRSKDWIGCLGIALTAGTPLLTADFKSVLSIPAETIKHIFVLITFAFLVLTFATGIYSLIKRVNVDTVVRDLKTKE